MANKKMYSLPIHVNENVLEKNPKFSQLLGLLSKKLTKNGTTLTTQHEIESAEKNVGLARQGWLMNHLPYYELQELVTELEVKSMEGALSLEEEQMTGILSQAVALSELGDYLPLPSSTSSHQDTLFGLTTDDLDRHNTAKQHLPAMQKAIVPILEERLKKKYNTLDQFFLSKKGNSVREEKEKDPLPSLVEAAKHRLHRDLAALTTLKEKKRDNFLLYYQSLLHCLSEMELLLRKNKLEVQVATDRITMDWMEAWCNAICTRAKLSMLELDCDTYTAKSVAALRTVRGHLDQTILDVEKEISATTQQLGAYRGVGPQLKPLVDQYTVLKKELDDCTWGIQHFVKSSAKAD